MYESRPHKGVILDVNDDGTYNVLDVKIKAILRNVVAMTPVGKLGAAISAYIKGDVVIFAYIDGSYNEPIILGAYPKVATPLNDAKIEDCYQVDVGPTQMQLSTTGATVLHKDVQLNLTEQTVELSTATHVVTVSADKVEVNADGQLYTFTKDSLTVAQGVDTAALTQKVIEVLTEMQTILTAMTGGALVPSDAAAVAAIATQVRALTIKLQPSYLGSQHLYLS